MFPMSPLGSPCHDEPRQRHPEPHSCHPERSRRIQGSGERGLPPDGREILRCSQNDRQEGLGITIALRIPHEFVMKIRRRLTARPEAGLKPATRTMRHGGSIRIQKRMQLYGNSTVQFEFAARASNPSFSHSTTSGWYGQAHALFAPLQFLFVLR